MSKLKVNVVKAIDRATLIMRVHAVVWKLAESIEHMESLEQHSIDEFQAGGLHATKAIHAALLDVVNGNDFKGI